MKSVLESGAKDGGLRHIALIPDGNGRWAKSRGLSVAKGHFQGAKSVEAFLNVCHRHRVKVATVWAFSTENWQRDTEEVDGIMQLVRKSLESRRKRLKENGVRVKVIGRRDRLLQRFPSISAFLTEIEEETKSYEPFILNLALDYGGRDEMVRALKTLVRCGITECDVNWAAIANALDTSGEPDPDLIIRTSGEQRLSGLMPLQSEYAELIFIDALLPDVTEDIYEQAISEFAKRNRRFGGRQQTQGTLAQDTLKMEQK